MVLKQVNLITLYKINFIRKTKMNRLILSLLLLLVFILVTYIIYRLIEREMEIRRKAAEDRAKELSTTEGIESIYKNDREFRRRMNKRDLFILAGLFAFFILCFIILLVIRLLSK